MKKLLQIKIIAIVFILLFSSSSLTIAHQTNNGINPSTEGITVIIQGIMERHVEEECANYSIQVLTLAGKTAFQEVGILNNEITINPQDWQNGVYTLKVLCGNEIILVEVFDVINIQGRPVKHRN